MIQAREKDNKLKTRGKKQKTKTESTNHDKMTRGECLQNKKESNILKPKIKGIFCILFEVILINSVDIIYSIFIQHKVHSSHYRK